MAAAEAEWATARVRPPAASVSAAATAVLTIRRDGRTNDGWTNIAGGPPSDGWTDASRRGGRLMHGSYERPAAPSIGVPPTRCRSRAPFSLPDKAGTRAAAGIDGLPPARSTAWRKAFPELRSRQARPAGPS